MANDVKDEKNKAKKKKSGSITRYFKDVRGEMKRVVWPSKKQVLNNTGIVLAFMLMASVVIGAFDSILTQIIKLSLRA